MSGLGRRLQLHGAEEGCSTVKVPVAGEERIDQSDLRRRKWNHESIIQGLPLVFCRAKAAQLSGKTLGGPSLGRRNAHVAAVMTLN